jgi:hypothetical protein
MTESEPGLGVTCRHVLSDHCGSLRHGLNPHPAPHQGGEFTQQVPDVAFIHLGSGCFGSGDEPSCEVIPTTQAKIYDLADQEEVVHKQPEADKTLGLILCAEMSGFKLGRFFYRGPHFSIKPYHLRRFGIIWRLDRSFSQGGDSGSWIVSRGGLWLGMVVGAYESPSNITVALSSEHIVNAFRKMNGLGSTSNERCSAFY